MQRQSHRHFLKHLIGSVTVKLLNTWPRRAWLFTMCLPGAKENPPVRQLSAGHKAPSCTVWRMTWTAVVTMKSWRSSIYISWFHPRPVFYQIKETDLKRTTCINIVKLPNCVWFMHFCFLILLTDSQERSIPVTSDKLLSMYCQYLSLSFSSIWRHCSTSQKMT